MASVMKSCGAVWGAVQRSVRINGRDVATFGDWLNAQSEEFRIGITYVAIDMAAGYAKAVRRALPHAQSVVDHFHVVELRIR